MFCVVRSVHKFDFRLVIKRLRHAAIGTHVFDRIDVSPPPNLVVSVKRIYPRYAGQLHSVE